MGTQSQRRLAMWSGPRNISTAMMRAWGNREDTSVCDEPLYAHYLQVTSLPHPGAEEVITHHETDWRRVVDWLTGPIPDGHSIFYQKHMAHHLLPDIGRDWLAALTHCFLIRDPKAMLISLAKHLPEPTLADTGLPQQVEIFQRTRGETGTTPVVVDSRDLLLAPEAMMTALCQRLDIEFTPRMLAWPPGERSTDGIWAKHWYKEVLTSTGFRPYAPKDEPLPGHLEDLYQQCLGPYRLLHQQRLVAEAA